MIENLYFQDDIQGSFIGYNVKIKNFSNGTKSIKKSSYNNFIGKAKNNRHNGTLSVEQLEYFKKRNLRRMKELIFDIAYENSCIVPWEYFVTLTFNDNIVNALDYDKAKDKLKYWLDCMRRKSRGMRYLIIAELHKSGRIHFHGLFSNVNWDLICAVNPHSNKKIVVNGSQIYNIKDFTYGYTTVSKIKDINAVSYYITKYITKDLLDIKNKKHYWTSKNLVKPKSQYYMSYSDEDFYNFLNSNGDVIDDVSIIETSESRTDYIKTAKAT